MGEEVPFEEFSEATANALKEFYQEKAERELHIHGSTFNDVNIEEDWELSQFWYDPKTANILANVALKAAGENGRIVCVSSPTAFASIRQVKPALSNHKLLEYDSRFGKIYPEHYVFYDYNDPLNIPENFKSAFDVVLGDPPYLSEECLEKFVKTIQYLAKDKIIVCTGAVMEDVIRKLLNLKACAFTPCHKNKLGNEFKCFVNFNFDEYCNPIL